MDYYISSPTVVLPPNPRYPFAKSISPSTCVKDTSPFAHSSPSNSSLWIPSKPTSSTMSFTNTAARKRSRDELDATSELLAESNLSSTPLESIQTEQNLHQLLRSGINIPARQQSFPTGDEISSTPTPASSPVHKSELRPVAESRKARRVFSSDTVPESSSQDKRLDKIAQLLGVGWRSLADDECKVAAARGWAKYIENHYPISNPVIILQSSGLKNAYLVEASEGYFLFDEEIKEGRLVATLWENCVVGLQAYPPLFEGAQTMKATQTPRAISTGDGSLQPTVETDDEAADVPLPQSFMDMD